MTTLQRLQTKQNEAVSVIRKTVDNLELINDELCSEISKNCGKINDLSVQNDNLMEVKSENNKLMRNFKKLLEV